MYHHHLGGAGGGGTPFSPHNMYSQQMMTPQMMQQPHSNAPATPATPQQQIQQPQSIGPPGSVQPGSVQLQQPGSVGMSMPIPSAGSAGVYSVGPQLYSTGGPASNPSMTTGPHSNQPQQPLSTGTSQHMAASNSSSSGTFHTGPIQTEFDPIASARSLILGDLRRSIMTFNQSAERGLDACVNSSQLQQHGNLNIEKHDEKKLIGLGIGGPHSNVGGPQSNPSLMNPHSVQNPLSVQNPQSVNPHSVTAMAPGSVKSTDEQHISGVPNQKEPAEELSVAEQYELAKNHFMNVCDNIERNLQLIMEVNRQQGKLYNQQAGSAVAWVEVAQHLHAPTTTLPQVLRGYTELMNADKQAIRSNIDSMNGLLAKLGGALLDGTDKTSKVDPMETGEK